MNDTKNWIGDKWPDDEERLYNSAPEHGAIVSLALFIHEVITQIWFIDYLLWVTQGFNISFLSSDPNNCSWRVLFFYAF